MDRRGWQTTCSPASCSRSTSATWVTALKMTSVAAATAMVSMQVVFVVVIDRLRGVRATAAVVGGMGLAIVGVSGHHRGRLLPVRASADG